MFSGWQRFAMSSFVCHSHPLIVYALLPLVTRRCDSQDKETVCHCPKSPHLHNPLVVGMGTAASTCYGPMSGKSVYVLMYVCSGVCVCLYAARRRCRVLSSRFVYMPLMSVTLVYGCSRGSAMFPRHWQVNLARETAVACWLPPAAPILVGLLQ